MRSRVRTRATALLAGLALLIAIAVVLVLVLGARSPSPATAADARSAAGSATVERRNLVQTDTESGTLSYAGPQTVYDRLSGTITSLPNVGQVIRPGARCTTSTASRSS